MEGMMVEVELLKQEQRSFLTLIKDQQKKAYDDTS